MNILIVNSSVQGDASVSNRLTGAFGDAIRRADPAARIVVRDVGSEPVPHLMPDTVAGVRAVAQTDAERRALALSDELVAELQDADLIVIGAPMYNFGIPSTLKAWFDHVLRARVTFRYTENGPEGLLKDKRAIVVETRAGTYSHGPAQALDGQEPHLRTMLGFIGLTDVEFLRVEGLAFDADGAVAAALGRIEALAGQEPALAA